VRQYRFADVSILLTAIFKAARKRKRPTVESTVGRFSSGCGLTIARPVRE
jgi:hypothetical protein